MSTQAAQPSGSGYRMVALIVASAFFMEQLDSTIISTALPAMAKSLGSDPLRMNFAMTAYLVALAAFVPLSDKVADRFGSRNIFRAAIVLFIISSLLCSIVPSLGWLIGARVLQGLSGAMMVPVGRLLLLRSIEKSEIVAAMTWVLFPAMVGPAVGPLIGGVLTTYLSWHWIFYINVPIGILGIVLATIYIPDLKEKPAGAKPKPSDWSGFALSAICLSTLIVSLESISHASIPMPLAITLFAIAILTGYVYWRHSQRHPAPVLDFRLLKIPTFRISMSGGVIYRIAYGGYPFLLPLMLQLGFGLSAAHSGSITFIGAAGGLLMKAISTGFLRKYGFRTILIWNGTLSAAMLAICAAFRPEWPVLLIYLVLLIGGLSRSLQFNAYGTIAYADMPDPHMGAATSMASVSQQTTAALGIALAALVLELSMLAFGHGSPQISDFSITFLVVGALCGTAVPLAFSLKRDAGDEVSGHKTPVQEGAGAT